MLVQKFYSMPGPQTKTVILFIKCRVRMALKDSTERLNWCWKGFKEQVAKCCCAKGPANTNADRPLHLNLEQKFTQVSSFIGFLVQDRCRAPDHRTSSRLLRVSELTDSIRRCK